VSKKWSLYLCLMLLLLTTATFAAEGKKSSLLSTNPFSQPELPDAAHEGEGARGQENSSDLVLRGTLVSGSDPLANINGVVLEVGAKLNGYRLVSVSEREVTLEKNGVRKTLRMDDD